MNSELVLARIEALPEESRQLLLALVDLLAEKADAAPRPDQKHVFKFDWEAGLADAFAGTTSVELQHRANEWR
ncbi:MAG: DUF2281 domain-containing protein [Limisphaerales bacterium]